jgi:tetratricopeptide (TPR) repeat protein
VRPVVKSKPSESRLKKTVAPVVKKTQKLAAVRAQRPTAVTPPPRRQPTVDEAAALMAFERAHREFTHGRFSEARSQFRTLLDKYSQVSEVAARARTYLAIAEARLRTENMLPRDADSLYDRGVIELNRGEYVAAQEMFERALKREPEAAHIHYGLAATRARLGSVDLALQSLQRALDLQPNLRVRAQHDHDLTSLRNDPDFDKLIFQPRP